MIYLDYAATTPLDKDVLEKMTPYLTEAFGNSSSQHSYGRRAANAVMCARDEVASAMGVKSDAVYFTSGGTESANTAIKGVCAANADRGRHIVISAIEHPAVTESAKDLSRAGYEVTVVNPDSSGVVRADSVERAIRQDTVLVAVMAANNETGVIQPVKDIYAVCKRYGVFYYCDCVQIAGVLNFKDFQADGIGISAHKFYGPKGVGALYINPQFAFNRLISGGGQERGLRGGTTYVAGAVGCGYALTKACAQAEVNNIKIARLRDSFVKEVQSAIEGVSVNGDTENRLPSNANLSFEDCDGEQILLGLDLKGIAVSYGSACSSGAAKTSPVLLSMGLGEARAKSAVRFTFGKYNTEEEVKMAVAALKSVVEKIREQRK